MILMARAQSGSDYRKRRASRIALKQAILSPFPWVSVKRIKLLNKIAAEIQVIFSNPPM